MKNVTTTTSLAALLAMAAACSQTPPLDSIEDELGESEHAVYDPANPPAPVATDACDDPSYPGAAWASQSSAHVTAYYIAGTAAETDAAAILAAREAAYGAITSALGIAATPTISVYLSPNRLAATANGKSLGNAFPGSDRIEAVYTGAAGSFEVTRPGTLMARVLEYHLDPANPKRIPILSVGLAEVLDQSGRDLHDAYALNLQAAVETRVRVNSFESSDVQGRNTGRAGSLVKFLIDRYGMATFIDIFKATAVTSAAGCSLKSATYGCINSAATLTAMLDGVLTAQTGDSWATAAALWKAEVDSHLASVSVQLSLADRNAIKNLVNLMDQAIETHDADVYRSTMEGFYCEWGGDAMRAEIAQRTIDAYAGSQTQLVRVYPTGTSNFPTARAITRRLDERNVLHQQVLYLEKLPQGWRVTYGPDWW
ncbi:MAG TPA: hypothetical protein VFU21_30070 [Kofleriaceae bacterium]|nr:hypothetical protein [Kofleriaceae bacterium]